MRQERARHGLAHQQRNHRMPLQPRRGIGGGRAGQRLVNAERFLAAAVGLAWRVDNGDDGALDRCVAVRVDDLMHGARQRPAFQQSHFAVAGARKRLSVGTTAISRVPRPHSSTSATCTERG
jgi:hypothetical protein